MTRIKFNSGLLNQIWHYSELPQTSISLRQMCQFGANPNPATMFKASCFVLRELPIRLAHRIKELESLPNGLNKMKDVIQVRDWYTQSFKELYEFSHDKSTSNGKLYQMLYGGLEPDTPMESEILQKIIQLCYRDEEMDSEHARTNTPLPHRNTFVDDGLVIMKKKWSVSNRPLSSSRGEVLIPKKYYSPPIVMSLEVWPKEILKFNAALFKVLQNIKVRHNATVVTLAKGVLKWKKTCQQNVVDDSIQSFLDRFYMSRIGIRMLIAQHLELLEASLRCQNGKSDCYVGTICTKTNITQIAEDAIDNARLICAEHYGLFEAPKVELLCFPKTVTSSNSGIEFMYVPGHLIHMLVETLKNTLRATVEKTIELSPGVDVYDLRFPHVKVIICEGLEDITVKISDEGGGIARSHLPLVWTYLYSTMPDDSQLELIKEESDGNPRVSSFVNRVPLAGYGYGLALSRLYARYFGGDLKLISMEGFGTDVYLHLNRLSTSNEPLQ
ncbi:hypothetical protein ZYGR_0AK03460 [Zygosaccharomyces rouxii]|uniref:Protein-serine/threonine kinase n=1 Tax=Zygosaccharomyces rouxii TaxID=4956 RepID=A0A1Q3ADM0_ZYGRO|nr:hypothetical protein ZYGR_0AK03460 [Zygosaccharomyces rouxii]